MPQNDFSQMLYCSNVPVYTEPEEDTTQRQEEDSENQEEEPEVANNN